MTRKLLVAVAVALLVILSIVPMADAANGNKLVIKRKLDLEGAEYELINDTNKNNEAAPGHFIALKGFYEDADGNDISDQVDSWEWDTQGLPEGRLIADYYQSIPEAFITPLCSECPGDHKMDFYWQSGSGTQYISLTATLSGGEEIFTQDYIDLKPPIPVSLMPIPTTLYPRADVRFTKPGDDEWYGLSHGTFVPFNPCIRWDFVATMPTVNAPDDTDLDGRGKVALTLLIKGESEHSAGGQHTELVLGDEFHLDDAATIWYQGESPVIPAGTGVGSTKWDNPFLKAGPQADILSYDSFWEVHFMYKPEGDNSIYVSMAKLDWDIAARAIWSDVYNIWIISDPRSNAYSATIHTEQPEWQHNKGDHQFTPVQ